jgi:ribulose 1,5-bisphosphate synthetase/thiazole synthase
VPQLQTGGRADSSRRTRRQGMAEIEREAMDYDVVIVGAGPAGL